MRAVVASNSNERVSVMIPASRQRAASSGDLDAPVEHEQRQQLGGGGGGGIDEIDQAAAGGGDVMVDIEDGRMVEKVPMALVKRTVARKLTGI